MSDALTAEERLDLGHAVSLRVDQVTNLLAKARSRVAQSALWQGRVELYGAELARLRSIERKLQL